VLARLAQVTPPRYVRRTFRGVGDEDDQLFEQGMQQYVAGNFGAATPTLRRAAAEHPGRTDIAFFLAASELMEHRYAAARAGFESVISQGPTPFVDEAHFYLAKACIGLGEVERARSALDAVIEGRGDLAREARRLSAELERLPEA
jgi:TolA-binding protein